ncbi:MAG TPA: hypothetical protein VH183_00450 [Burkholderiaceae bacterium]|jgi:hypothetical protein|nr:hypothetical protein [Burkholderiaceae bacterium]
MHKFNLREQLDEFVLEQAAQDIAKSMPREEGLLQRLGFRQAGILSSTLLARFRDVPSRTA